MLLLWAKIIEHQILECYSKSEEDLLKNEKKIKIFNYWFSILFSSQLSPPILPGSPNITNLTFLFLISQREGRKKEGGRRGKRRRVGEQEGTEQERKEESGR